MKSVYNKIIKKHKKYAKKVDRNIDICIKMDIFEDMEEKIEFQTIDENSIQDCKERWISKSIYFNKVYLPINQFTVH